MANNKATSSRDDGVTKDMQSEAAPRKRSWTIPGIGVSIEAETYQDALKEAKKIIKKRKEEENQ